MKKLLFCAGLLALAASCTENEMDSISGQSGQKQGITFEAGEAGDATTRGGFTPDVSSYVPFWYAETDKISVWATNIGGTNGANANEDKFLTAKVSEYKATQSAKKGVFTSVSDNDLLTFLEGSDAESPSNFLAVYPNTLKNNAVFDKTGSAPNDEGTILTTGILTDLATQIQKDENGDGIYDLFIKWSVTSSYKQNAWDAVGEKINLDFQRPLAGVIFATENADKYLKGENSTFGKLKQVTLTALGSKADGTGGDASNLTYGTAAKLKITTNIGTEDAPKAEIIEATTNPASAITLKMADATPAGLAWSDANRAYMVIAPVTREKGEYMKVKYEFENIDFEVTNSPTSNPWPAGGFIEFPTLDVSKYDYLVTKGANSTLIINKGNLSSIISEDGTGIVWPVGSQTATQFASIKNIICNVSLGDTDLAKIAKFTALEGLTLAEDTKLPANMLANSVAATLKTLIAPKVKKIDKGIIATGSNAAFSALVNLELNSYQFEDENVNALFFNDNVKATLKTLNIEAVENMLPTFGIDRALSFMNYAALETITVKSTGLKVAPNAFNGCKLLKTINGKLDMAGAVSAFEMADNTSNANKVLATVNITGAVIPEKAFKNCTALASILLNGAQVAPTEIGASAFENAAALEYMDLKNATAIGASAFSGCSKYAGAKKNDNVLEVGVATVSKSVFANTKVVMVKFTNATKIEGGIFNGVTSLKQIKFVKAFTVKADNESGYWDNTFSTPGNIDLFINPAQLYMTGTTMKLPNKSGTADFTFKTVQKE